MLLLRRMIMGESMGWCRGQGTGQGRWRFQRYLGRPAESAAPRVWQLRDFELESSKIIVWKCLQCTRLSFHGQPLRWTVNVNSTIHVEHRLRSPVPHIHRPPLPASCFHPIPFVIVHESLIGEVLFGIDVPDYFHHDSIRAGGR